MPDSASWKRVRASRRGRVGIALFLACIVNFLAFGIIAICIGGDAVNGEVVDGRYFLSSKGKLTQVSKAVFQYSYCHTVSVPASFLVALVGWALAAMAGEPDTKNPKPSPPDDPVVVTIEDPTR